MFKNLLILILSFFLLFSCSKNSSKKINEEPQEDELGRIIYAEAVEALKEADAFYAAKNLKKQKPYCLHILGLVKQVLWLITLSIPEMHIRVLFLD